MVRNDFKKESEWALHLLINCINARNTINTARALRVSRPTLNRYLAKPENMSLKTYERLQHYYEMIKKESEFTK